jgi:hypothetical protein
MRYVTFSLKDDHTPRLGVIDSGEVVDLQSLAPSTGFGQLPGSMIGLIEMGPARWAHVADVLAKELSEAG